MSRLHFEWQLIGALVLAVGLAACSDDDDDFDFGAGKDDPLALEVEIMNAADLTQVLGTATFKDSAEGGVTVTLEVAANDVIPAGDHAIHIHAVGSCDEADSNRDGVLEAAGAAAGHFNPEDVGHGDDNGPHPGDSEQYNYTFNDDGSFSGEIRFPEVSLYDDNALARELGSAFMIHTGTDDAVTDPTGNAGARLACGVIVPVSDDWAHEAVVVSAANTERELGTITLWDRAEGGVVARFDIPANDVIAPGEHAIHVHQNASCDPADTNEDGETEPAGAAGGHYNPQNVGHGGDNGPHVGDPEAYNYTFAADGSFSGDVLFPEAGLYRDYPLLAGGGTAVVIHTGTDDTTTDPTGNAGARVACAVLAP